MTDHLAQLRTIAAEEKQATADFYRRKMDAIATAQDTGATKDAIAANLGITRPTLDAWIRDRDDRILFNDALAILAKTNHPDIDTALINRLYSALGIRSIPAQADAILEGFQELTAPPINFKASLTKAQADLIQRAVNRAWLVVGQPED